MTTGSTPPEQHRSAAGRVTSPTPQPRRRAAQQASAPAGAAGRSGRFERFRSVADLLERGSHLLDAHPDDGDLWAGCALVHHDGFLWQVGRTARSADLALVAKGHPTAQRVLGGTTTVLFLDSRPLQMRAAAQRPRGWQPAQRRLRRRDAQALQHRVVDAAVAVLATRGPQRRGDLLRRLSRQCKLPTAGVLQALEADPRVHVAADVIGMRAVAPQAAVREAHPAPQRGLHPDPVSDLAYALSLTDTDEVLLRLNSPTGDAQIRADYVRTGPGEIWVTAKVTDEDLYHRLAAVEGTQQLGPELRLPLRAPAAVPAGLPTALVWCGTTAATAAATITRVQMAWAGQSEGWRTERVSCTPAELERRVDGERTIRRLRARATSRVPVTTCDRCGLPLSDPTSVALGIGPECRKYYQREVLTIAARRDRIAPVRLASKPPRQWARLIQTWLWNPEPR